MARRNRVQTLGDGAPQQELHVRGASLHRLKLVSDERGDLIVGELNAGLPFVVRRYFLVGDVSSGRVRGEHAHRELEQFLVCLRGQCSVIVDDGVRREELVLNDPTIGLHVAPMVWAVQHGYSPDGLLLVLASAEYDPADYIRDYDEFLRAVRR